MRTVILENAIRGYVDAVNAKHPRIEDQMRAIEWRIARRPEDGVLIHESFYLYRQKGVGKGNPDITILYTFTEHEVTIHDVRFV